jgi:LuxR family maltose regulon positive regulatory protein
VLVTKLQPPTPRAQWVQRERLFERLRHEPGVRLTVVAAPAGSGKTTLLGMWREVEAERRPVAWVSLDDGDNDPVVLWSHVLEALRRACPTLEPPRLQEVVGVATIADAVLTELVNSLAEQGEVTLILDDFHRLQHGPSRESVTWLVEHVPPSFQLVISTRSEPALALSALRARGELRELRAGDLGFSAHEANLLLNDRLGLGLDRDDVDELVERTEGWSAGLYLAALSLGGVQDRHAFVNRFGGTSLNIVNFLVDEVLEAHDPALQELMLRCSVLERLCGPLCDALCEGEGSGERLSELASLNLFLVPLDDRGQWYRFHHLFRQLLRVELERRKPGLAESLHRRAYAWHRDHGAIDEAVDHMLDAAAFDDAADLICARWEEYAYVGGHPTVLAWIERFPSEIVAAHPALLTVKAWLFSMCALREQAAAAIASAEELDCLDEGPLPDGASSVRASLATLKAMVPFGDVGSAHANALLASELERPESRNWPRVCWARGMAHFHRGEAAEAEFWFAETVRLSSSRGTWMVLASALACQSLIAGDQGDLERQRRLAEQAAQVAHEHDIDGCFIGEVPLSLGVSHAACGRLTEARPLFERSISAFRSSGQPLGLAHALIRQSRVLTAQGERGAAEAALAEARQTVDSCSDPGVLAQELQALDRRPRARGAQSGHKLSRRELVVLRALTGPLSERDIGRELYLSHSTVHSHAQSIYRKLGVSSRADAVRSARKLELL